jgi:hypothetical protein
MGDSVGDIDDMFDWSSRTAPAKTLLKFWGFRGFCRVSEVSEIGSFDNYSNDLSGRLLMSLRHAIMRLRRWSLSVHREISSLLCNFVNSFWRFWTSQLGSRFILKFWFHDICIIFVSHNLFHHNFFTSKLINHALHHIVQL